MSVTTLAVLKCDGIHGERVYSTTVPEIALLLDGWTIANMTEEETLHFCPECSVSHFTLKMLHWVLGLPGCGYALQHNLPTLFLYDIWPPKNSFDHEPRPTVWKTR